MKKILVLTDFSENSINAYRYAAKLVYQLKADIMLLFSTNGNALSLTDQFQYSQQLHSFAMRYAGDARSQANSYHTECLISSDLWQQLIKTMVQVHQPDLIIAGCGLLKPIEHNQEALSLAEFEACPILWIPEKANYQPLQNIVFATDFTDQDEAVIEQVRNFAGLFGADVSLVHFYSTADRNHLAGIKREGVELHGKLEQFGAPYYLLEEEYMIEGLEEYAGRAPVDLFLIATRDTHLSHQYLQPNYRKTQACQTSIPLLNLFQAKQKPCAGDCAYCHHHADAAEAE